MRLGPTTAATLLLAPMLLLLALAPAGGARLLVRTAVATPTRTAAALAAFQLPPQLTSRRPLTAAAAAASASPGGVNDDDEAAAAAGPSREEMVAAMRARMAKVAAKKKLMVGARKDKLRRHKRKREATARGADAGQRARAREEERRATAAMEALYQGDAVAEPSQLPPGRLRIAVDLAYDDRDSQYSSLARQLGCAYGFIRKEAAAATASAAATDAANDDDRAAAPLPALTLSLSDIPPHVPSLHLTSAAGPVMESLGTNGGGAWRLHRHERPVFEVFPRERLVYLSPDSPNVLESIDPSKIYVIGGLVDRVILKGKSQARAKAHGVATARLPLKDFFQKAPRGGKYLSDLCLAVDRVIEILVRFRADERGDWDAVLRRVFPGAYGGGGKKEEEG